MSCQRKARRSAGSLERAAYRQRPLPLRPVRWAQNVLTAWRDEPGNLFASFQVIGPRPGIQEVTQWRSRLSVQCACAKQPLPTRSTPGGGVVGQCRQAIGCARLVAVDLKEREARSLIGNFLHGHADLSSCNAPLCGTTISPSSRPSHPAMEGGRGVEAASSADCKKAPLRGLFCNVQDQGGSLESGAQATWSANAVHAQHSFAARRPCKASVCAIHLGQTAIPSRDRGDLVV